MVIANTALDGILLIIPEDCIKVSSRCRVEERGSPTAGFVGIPPWRSSTGSYRQEGRAT